MANGKLPAAERVSILRGRVQNLLRGSGRYATNGHQWKAIEQAEQALREAESDLAADLAKETAH